VLRWLRAERMDEQMNNKPGTFRILEIKTVHSGWTKVHIATVQLPDGHTFQREIEDHGEAICVLPYHPGRKTAVLVRQPRIPLLYTGQQEQSLEVVAGVIEEKDPDVTVHREVMEEAKLKLDSIEHVFTAWTMPGISTERMHFYLAQYSGAARPETEGGTDEDEETVAIEFPLAELARMADANELPDSKTLVLLQTLRLRRPELF
jgi:nudix-type nucleoside diphosphatase (YffH/AdpP family)